MTDKIEVEKLAVMKERENRDLDTLVDENTLVAGETGAGVFGVFKFFQGIRNFFKGIQALGTLVTTSKIPVLQDDGSLKFTTPADITSGLATTTELNNALTDITKGIPLTETDLDNVKTEGLYVSNQNTVYTNTPHSTGMYFSLHVIRTNNLSTTGYKQIVHLYSSNQTFERVWTYSSETGMHWEHWVKVVTKTDIPYYNTTFTLTESELGYLEASFQNADNYTIFQGTTTAGYELGWQGFKHTDSKVCFIIGYSRQYGVFSGKRSTNGNWEFRNIINY